MQFKIFYRVLLLGWLLIIILEYIYNHFILGGPGIVENITFGLSIFLGFILLLFSWYQERYGFKIGFLVIEGLLFLGGAILIVSVILSSKI